MISSLIKKSDSWLDNEFDNEAINLLKIKNVS